MTLYRFDQIADNIRIPVMPEPGDSERYIGLEHMDSGSLRIRRWGAPTTLIGQKLTMKEGDVLFARRNAYLRRVAVAPFDGVFSAHGMVLRAKTDVCLHEFLPVFMESDYFMERAIKISVGSLSPTINWSTLAREEFTLPPLDEQRRIAALLWAADEAVEAKRVLLEKLQIIRVSLINAIIADPSNEPAKTYSLEDVCEMQNGRGFPSDDYTDRGIKLLRPGNLGNNGYLHWDSYATKCLPIEYKEIAAAFLVKPGDVVMNLTAQSLEEGFIGRVCLARNGDESLLNQRIGRFKCHPNLEPAYLYRCFQTQRFRRTAESRCEGSKIKHMYWHHIANFPIVVPDLETQSEAIESCAAIDDTIYVAESDIQTLSILKKQLLAVSFG